MATVPDTAKARPIYLSSSMKGLVGGERRLWEKAWLVVNTQSATRLDKRIYVSIQHKKGTSCILSYLIYKILSIFNLWSNLSKFIFLFHLTLVRRHFYSFIFISFKFSLFLQVFPWSTIWVGHMHFNALRIFRFRPRLTRPIPRSTPYRSLSAMGAVGTQTVNTTERLAALRNLMAERNIDAYVVPSEDQRKHSDLSDRGFTAIEHVYRF